MTRIVFEGPEDLISVVYEGQEYALAQDVECDVPDELADALLELNPRGLPVSRKKGDVGHVAADYGMKVFRVVYEEAAPEEAAEGGES